MTLELHAKVAVPTTLTVNGAARPLSPTPDVATIPIDAPLRVGTNSVAFACAPDTTPGCVDLESIAFVFAH